MNREEWLSQAVEKLNLIFTEKGYQLPTVRVSCGFPSTGNSVHVGQCWAKYSSEENINQIFISPVLDDPVKVLDTLMHELVHAVDNCAHGHGSEFKKIALSVGLQGKMRSASAGEKLEEKLTLVAAELPAYPHKKLIRIRKERKYRPTPKARCNKCGYQINVPKKWVHIGAPLCPLHKIKMDEIGNWNEE